MIKKYFRPKAPYSILIYALALIVTHTSHATEELSYAKAVKILGSEQIIGENCAGLLKSNAKEKSIEKSTEAQGILLYARAQASFNSLIEELKGQLIVEAELKNASSFHSALDQSIKKREALTDYMNAEIISKQPTGTKSISAIIAIAESLGGGAKIVEALNSAILEIWREYKKSEEDQRRLIFDQLDSLKWRSYEKIPALYCDQSSLESTDE